MDKVLCFARVCDAVCGGRRPYPSTITKSVLERLGFVGPERCEDIVEAEIYSQLDECQAKFFQHVRFPLRSISFMLDPRETLSNRYVPISSHESAPLFDWDGQTLAWLEHLKQLRIQREKEALLKAVKPLDKGMNRARLCFVNPCSGVQVIGG